MAAAAVAPRGTIWNTTAPTIDWTKVPLSEYDLPESKIATLLHFDEFKWQGNNYVTYRWSNAETHDAMYQTYLADLRDQKMMFIHSQKGTVRQWCPDCNFCADFNFMYDCPGKCSDCESANICYILESERRGDCTIDLYHNWDTFHRVVIESIIQDDETFCRSLKKHRNFTM